MEHSLSSLAYKGTIIEAITKAKQEKKLFVVYLANDNSDSKQLETSAWTDPNVSETLTKYCVLLHILEGTSEASQFSAIYPQNSSPSITAIGYNGVQLWQTEGVVSAEVLASSLEKAWLSLHVQEKTAALLTAALVSEQNASQTSENVSSVQETPSANEASSSRRDHIPSLNVGQLNSETIEERNSQEYKVADSKPNNEASLKAPHASVGSGGINESTSKTVTQNTSLEPHQTDPSNSEKHAGENSELHYKQNNEALSKASHANVDAGGLNESASKVCTQNTSIDPHQTEKRASPIPRENLGEIDDPSNNVSQEANKVVKPKTSETIKVQKTHTSASPAAKSNDVFLNIRMPDGSSLQVKFTVMDTLRMVKDYISENSTSNIGSFDLAIPYPRKVFNEQELIRTLSSLGLFNRQALVVIPHKQPYSRYGGGSSSSSTYSSNGSSNGDAGYWASLRRVLSYANPFSYFGGGAVSPNVAEGSQSGTWQYSSNPSLGNNLRGAGTPSTGPSSDQNSAPANPSGSRQKASGFGSNIHTLKRDEDNDQPNDRNMFWNGNSTEYGGDSDGK